MNALPESLAIQKFCPFKVAARSNLCVGQSCMAWRWSEPSPRPMFKTAWRPLGGVDPRDAEPSRPPEVPTIAMWMAAYYDERGDYAGGVWKLPQDEIERQNDIVAMSRRGFCGLAGWADL